jgi:glycosyltransferase involved in cell wall biosynthesis
MERLVASHPIVIAFGYLLRQYPVIRRKARYLVMDLYDPFILENLLMHDDLPRQRRQEIHGYDLSVVIEQLRQADFFVCASERQRDYWLGALSIVNRINPDTHAADPTLRRLIDVVPFGLPSAPPRVTGSGMRDQVAGIDSGDFVVIWGGGIWNWFDPLTAIRAVGALRDEIPALRLFFMGLRHPNPDLPQMAMARQAVALAEELGLLDRLVFFREGWVPYQKRADYLLAADLGISLHQELVETRFSFRTRILDYLWAGLPVIATAGDVLSEELTQEGAGISVGEGDLDGVVEALRTLARDPARRQAMHEQARRVAERHSWQRAAAPLLEFCGSPRQAPIAPAPILEPLQPLARIRAAWWGGPIRRAASRLRRRLKPKGRMP